MEETHSFIKVGCSDIEGVLRGKYLSEAKFNESGSIGFCNVIFGWDLHDATYSFKGLANEENGYRDAVLSIDLSTHRNLPWMDNEDFYLGDFRNDTQLSVIDPRFTLLNIISEMVGKGFIPVLSQEFEFYNFLQTESGRQPITSGMYGYSVSRLSENKDYFHDILTQLPLAGISIEGFHTETGPGVLECALEKKRGLEAADNAFLFKAFVKEIGKKHGIIPSFMAKWNTQYPGSSGHIHQSIEDEGGKNLFEMKDGKPSGIMEHYLAGQLYCLRELMPFLAPNINSYKRFVKGAWAPVKVDFGVDDRTRAIRLISGTSGARIEHRVPGADVNPYLAMAACLASGFYGIQNKITLDDIKPDSISLPDSLRSAVDILAESKLATELLPEALVQHVVASRYEELNKFNKAITDWELHRYLEII